jgi:hypothetical protein
MPSAPAELCYQKPTIIVDLTSLHGDPRFDALVAKAGQIVNAQPH